MLRLKQAVKIFALKLDIAVKKNRNKLEFLRARGYPTEERAEAEAGAYGYVVIKDLARHWISVNKRGHVVDKTLFDQYFVDFNFAKTSGKRPVSHLDI
jgi:hypothetical protein